MVCETHLTTYINLFLEAIISVSRGLFCREPYKVSNSLANVESTTYRLPTHGRVGSEGLIIFTDKILQTMAKHKHVITCSQAILTLFGASGRISSVGQNFN